MKYELLKSLLPYIEEFEDSRAKSSEKTVDHFLEWMQLKKNSEHLQQHTSKGTMPDDFKMLESPPKAYNSPSIGLQGDIHAQISQLLALMHKYLKFYLKKAFENTPLSGPDDFGFIATLLLEGRVQKNVLIEKNTIEFTSGMEVIKRLEKNGLIDSMPDQYDKRAKTVGLTPEGKAIFFRIIPTIQKIGLIATANLSEMEKEQLLMLLKKLDHFHNPIFHDAKKDDIDGIVEKFMN